MVLFNYALKELTAKIVYYGPGLSGKTTNLQYIYDELPIKNKGRMLTLATETDRTLYFDFLPLEATIVRGIKTRIQLYTVPGQVYYNATRRMVLKGTDGIVFVADSQRSMMEANLESLTNLHENLQAHDLSLEELPLLFQYNKRDLPDIMDVEEMNERLNTLNAPFYEAVATEGIGVEETLKAIGNLVLKSVLDKYGGAKVASAATASSPRISPPAPAVTRGVGGGQAIEKTDPVAVSRPVSAAAGRGKVLGEDGDSADWRLKAVTDPVGKTSPAPDGVSPQLEKTARTWPPISEEAGERARRDSGHDEDETGQKAESTDHLNLEGILDDALKLVDQDEAVEGTPPVLVEGESADEGGSLSGVLDEALGGEASPVEPASEGAASVEIHLELDPGPSVRKDESPLSDEELESLAEGLESIPAELEAEGAGLLGDSPFDDMAKTRLPNPAETVLELKEEVEDLVRATPASLPAVPVEVEIDSKATDKEPLRVVVPVRLSIDKDAEQAEFQVLLKIRVTRGGSSS